MTVVTVFVHAVNALAHPSAAGKWRWAVHLGSDPRNLAQCGNAWGADSRAEAEFWGEAVAACSVKFLRMAGLQVRYAGVQQLDFDPVPAGGDLVQVVR